MPTRTPVKKKKVMKKVTAKKSSTKQKTRKIVAKNIAKKIVKKISKPKTIGSVIHFYDRIGVAIIDLVTPVAVGDALLFKRGDMELFEQRIESMQIDHVTVTKAKKGDVVGVKVRLTVPEGTVVLPG